MGKISIVVNSVKEYREKMKHAEGLGLSVKEAYFVDGWEAANDEPIHLSGSYDVEKVGRKYLHVTVTGPDGPEIAKVKPAETYTRDRGYVRLQLVDQ